MKKIVICPTFASSHFLEHHIQNIIDVIDPDVIIYNEGLFPSGPEDKGHVDSEEFRSKYIFPDQWPGCDLGFDWKESNEIASKYPSKVLLYPMLYHKKWTADRCFLEAISTHFGGLLGNFVPEVGDIIFPLEPDAFVHEQDEDVIKYAISRLKPGEGIKVRWIDFLETQYYTEAINMGNPKYRRFAYCFDNMENYRAAMDGFKSQNYSKLELNSQFDVYHYPWFVYEKWKELRFDLIYRSDPKYWEDFENGIREIRSASIRWANYLKPNIDGSINMNKLIPQDRILIRPTRQDAGRYASFIEVSHPKHIQSHPNFVK